MSQSPKTVKEYLEPLPDERRKVLKSIRKVIRANLDKSVKEGIQYGMMAYFVPHSVYPAGYHCKPSEPLPFMSVASLKSGISIHMFCLYSSPKHKELFSKEWLATGKKLNMGKSCVRIKTLEDIPLEVLGRAVKRMTAKKFIAEYEAAIGGGAKAAKKTAPKKAAAKKTTPKKAAPKKPAAKKPASKKKPAPVRKR